MENLTNNQIEHSQEWQSYVEPMLPIGERMLGGIDNSQDPRMRQELYQMIFSEISEAYLALLHSDAEHPDFRPIFNMAHNIGSPNPDDVYYLAPISGSGSYRISGFRGTVRIIDFQINSDNIANPGMIGATVGQYDVDTLHLRHDGAFEVLLSAERPAGYTGDWWKLDSKAAYILVRQIAYDWLNEIDGRFAIERLDRPAIRPRPGASEIEQKLRQIPVLAERLTKLGPQWVETYRAKGLINKAGVHSYASAGGVPTQQYVEGIFELNPDEALIYETEVPARCRYWNIALNNMLWSTIDWTNRQSSLNGFTAKLDKDGVFRAVISAVDPGVPNWLDTAGYARGTFLGRWLECSSSPAPKITRVKLVDVRARLPADTPVVTAAERDAEIRLRRKAVQLRRRW